MNQTQKLKKEIREMENKIGAFDVATGKPEELNDLAARRNGLIIQLETVEEQVVETRESDSQFLELRNASQIGEVVNHAMGGGPVNGATAEFQQELGMASNEISVRQLWTPGEVQYRAVTPAPGNVQGNQQATIGYVFPNSVADFLAIPRPVVGVGETVYPVLTSKLSVEALAENAAGTETTGAFSAEKLSPARLQASFFYSREDRASFVGMEESLRINLRDGLNDGLDNQLLVGTNGLLAGTNLADHDATAAFTYANYLSNLAYGRVDGIYAGDLGNIRMVLGADTFAHMGATVATSTDVSAADKIAAITGGYRVSAHVPDAASNKQEAVIRLGSRMDAVAPIWENVALIEDQITKAANGQIVITAVMLYNLKILRTGGFYKQETQHA